MRVIDELTLESEFGIDEGSSLPPDWPGLNGDGGSGPEDDRRTLMLLIHDARGSAAVSLRYLRSRTGFPRSRLWRAFEDLEDVGYIEVSDSSDPRGPVTRWLDNRGSRNERVFASTFVVLTEAGRCELELQASVTVPRELGSRLRDDGSKSSLFVALRDLFFRIIRLQNWLAKTQG